MFFQEGTGSLSVKYSYDLNEFYMFSVVQTTTVIIFKLNLFFLLLLLMPLSFFPYILMYSFSVDIVSLSLGSLL